MTAAVDGGLAATAADDGVASMTTTSRLQAAMAEQVMAMVAGSGVVAAAEERGVVLDQEGYRSTLERKAESRRGKQR